ncbi:DUF3990 domain-containing protein [Candidatus Bathycorpusculum sp.]|uniref:DUF3990 domain-containing protein n=1 Tax=Candidatus Bathycorpusculum sp. TaxID=2994959 RepID=UPI0028242C85|nr:DUF3990 domain-containing protein [Candidatus Termitimicrobium sp.]MCL2685024.1 DUF3990 domain-containing protein [Candidatus Termitimicrobium sp.]
MYQKHVPFKDFGRGFYLTENKEHAERMAVRVADRFGGNPNVSAFELSDEIFNDKALNILKFENPNKEWALFVVNNRSLNFRDAENKLYNGNNKYDVVIGAVANDDLVSTFDLFRSGFMSIDDVVKQITYKNLTNQYSFHSEKAIAYLKAVE